MRKVNPATKKLNKKKPPVLKKDKKRKIYIDINSSKASSFELLKLARTLCKEMELNWPLIYEELTASDYDHFLEVFDKHFEDFVTFYE